jgi:type IV pilus assembly protein PilO
MTNLQDSASRISATTLRRIWLWLPIATGAALAVALIAAVLTPLWLSLERDSERLRQVEALTSRLADERLRAKRVLELEEKVGAQQRSLIRLISGNGDISTFLAQLDQLAKATDVQLDLYEPRPAAAAAPDPATPNNARGNNQEPPPKPPVDPLEVEGMQSNAVVMAARGSFPQLLSFLRQLEALNVLVVQSDLQLNLEAKAGATTPQIGPERVLLKMALKLYSKKPEDKQATTPARMAGQTPSNPPANGTAGTAAPPN